MFNGLYPAINNSTSSINSAVVKVSDRIEARVEILQIGKSGSQFFIWVKNVGTQRIVDIPSSDLFYGLTDNYSRITYGGAGTPRWSYQLEGGFTEWEQAVTCKITLTLPSAPAAGTYAFKVVIPNGIYDETTYSVK
ncbi:MAG: hypothetical protein PHE50_01855 [Dehalococcoidales bacterium]|nr:hypothetical protein [Dehalococcoidales bacterium]